MPDADTRDDKEFFEDVPPPNEGFFLKGSGAYDWGIKDLRPWDTRYRAVDILVLADPDLLCGLGEQYGTNAARADVDRKQVPRRHCRTTSLLTT